ncbi:hypothetical protein [Reichenbachiella ulvae]|uniref:MORN repeat variant n=1 Tax=Reichenbachiella ulvae TaxID=2980104 RepID=A0ABT3CTY1_9BACT|nr:hypothetical protein [Reichenbachiella ulvae]MCV9387146.1 hypothetical protein [Reichenbachiella ulvae]
MKLLLTFLLSLSLLNGLSAQDQAILEIRKLYNETQINKDSYSRTTQNDFENSSEGGEITAFKDVNGIRLIETIYYGHLGKSENEYYFAEGQLYFAFVKNYRYNAPPTQPEYDHTKTTKEEYRYYFWNNNMIRCIQPDGTYMNTNTEDFEYHKQRISSLADIAMEQID